MTKYILISSKALDVALMGEGFSDEDALPNVSGRIHKIDLSSEVSGFRLAREEETYSALIRVEQIERLYYAGASLQDIYRRIARVVTGLKSPPVHLPRAWSEYHYQNLLAFFASPRESTNCRWIAEIDGGRKCVRFESLTDASVETSLQEYQPPEWPNNFSRDFEAFFGAKVTSRATTDVNDDALARHVELPAIGSSSVVQGRTYEDWYTYLTEEQKILLNEDIRNSIRIVGPAGSGKTLTLCLRALQVSRDETVVGKEERILLATHSWAMSERIDAVLRTLNSGAPPERITVFPLMSLLDMHAGHIGSGKVEVIGDDSSDGRNKTIEILASVVNAIGDRPKTGLSNWIVQGLDHGINTKPRRELIINLYEEITGVLSASGVAPDDADSIREYLRSEREDWMPPFVSLQDRGFVVDIYKLFLSELVDRASITTDQYILDSIRVLETFSWRMRRETEGYDFIFVDELQLFDPQERACLELLGRSRNGVPFVSAEDPSQGIFSALNARRATISNKPIYLDTLHRFKRGVFDFISFIYQKFPLNALPLRIENEADDSITRPEIIICAQDDDPAQETVTIVSEVNANSLPAETVCVITIGDVDSKIGSVLRENRIHCTELHSFDDVEKLAYVKRTVVVSPWEFIGGTQFDHVIVAAFGINKPESQFARLREMISVYLACSRAARSLRIIGQGYVPAVIIDALDQGLIEQK
jgi:hypothetical protein